jgi:hypothetical protein
LANELFADRSTFREFLTSFPRVLPLAARLGQASPDRPLEGMLASLREEAVEYPTRHSDLAAVQYYLQSLIWQCDSTWHRQVQAVTNYLALLDRIQRWRRRTENNVLFSTFNYDRLFEYAASFYITKGESIFSNSYDTLASYIAQPHFPILKLHGSVDWGYRVDTKLPIVRESNGHVWQIAWEVIRRYADLAISPNIEKVDERPPKPQSDKAYTPALALPVDTKSQFVCPPNHLVFLTENLPKVKWILIIGWRGMEAHFIELLKQHLPRDVSVLAVCGDAQAGEQTIERVRGFSIGNKHEVSPDGFSSFVVGPIIDRFLQEAFCR